MYDKVYVPFDARCKNGRWSTSFLRTKTISTCTFSNALPTTQYPDHSSSIQNEHEHHAEIENIQSITRWVEAVGWSRQPRCEKRHIPRPMEGDDSMLGFGDRQGIHVNGFLPRSFLDAEMHNAARSILSLQLLDMASEADTNIVFRFSEWLILNTITPSTRVVRHQSSFSSGACVGSRTSHRSDERSCGICGRVQLFPRARESDYWRRTWREYHAVLV